MFIMFHKVYFYSHSPILNSAMTARYKRGGKLVHFHFAYFVVFSAINNIFHRKVLHFGMTIHTRLRQQYIALLRHPYHIDGQFLRHVFFQAFPQNINFGMACTSIIQQSVLGKCAIVIATTGNHFSRRHGNTSVLMILHLRFGRLLRCDIQKPPIIIRTNGHFLSIIITQKISSILFVLWDLCESKILEIEEIVFLITSFSYEKNIYRIVYKSFCFSNFQDE